MDTVSKEWLSYEEVQKYAGIGRTKLWELVSSGKVPAAKLGRSVRISRGSLDEYLRSQSYLEVITK